MLRKKFHLEIYKFGYFLKYVFISVVTRKIISSARTTTGLGWGLQMENECDHVTYKMLYLNLLSTTQTFLKKYNWSENVP